MTSAKQLLRVHPGDLMERLLLSGLHAANQLALEDGFALGHTHDSPLAIKRFIDSRSLSKIDSNGANSAQTTRRVMGNGELAILISAN